MYKGSISVKACIFILIFSALESLIEFLDCRFEFLAAGTYVVMSYLIWFYISLQLWFPLYSVLQRRHTDNMDEYNNTTIRR